VGQNYSREISERKNQRSAQRQDDWWPEREWRHGSDLLHLRARKGQTLILNLTSEKKNAVFGVYAPGMDLVEGAQSVDGWTGTLPKTGQYEIIVFPQDEATDTNFTLKITIE